MSDDPVPTPIAPPLRVLLLDDDSFMLDLLEDMLGEIGPCAVQRALTAQSALVLLGASDPELLICDLSMPDMDGIEFLQAAGAAGFRGQVMLLSGMEDGVRNAAERLARAHGLMLLGAFQKPISAAQLRAALAPLPGMAHTAHADSHNLTTRFGK